MARTHFRALRIPKHFLILGALIAAAGWIGMQIAPAHSPVPVLSTAVQTDAEDEPKPPAKRGEPAPDFTLSDANGNPVSLSSYQGRPVLLYFWATWCPHCREAMPQLARIKNAHADEGLEILAVDILESPDKVKEYLAAVDLPFPVLLDRDGRVSERYLIRVTPTYVFVDRDGVYRDILIGTPRRGALEGRLLPLLKSPEKDRG